MNVLDFPAFDYRVKKIDGRLYIFDRTRKRYVMLTPEEWVRQHLIRFLADHRGYPETLIAVEQEIEVCGLRKRFDVVCHDRRGVPYLIVECKAPDVPLTRATFDQVFRYNLSVEARLVAITNGRVHLCGEVVGGAFHLLPGIPFYAGDEGA
ncbi:MAG: type I restriction enzyme HsdR N-terminal domain-containing protein [Odoribacteraceae bacterium]|nr:type I restriction enzyme HsdR N-terminal domain-containing protein [Odoribacteraceae bacterium]